MKNKAFTLVELLAVIIILGVISLLIVPKVINTINESEQKTNMASAEALLTAAQYKYQNDEIKNITENIIIDYTTGQNTSVLDYSGKKPEEGKIKITKDGKTAMAVKIGNNCYIKEFYANAITVTNYNESTCIIPKLITLVNDADENNQISIGDEYRIETEHFYVVSSDQNQTVLIAKYNLNVGDNKNPNSEEGLQSQYTLGQRGTVLYNYNYLTNAQIYEFSPSSYWSNNSIPKQEYGDSYTCDVYDDNSNLYTYIENYKNYINKIGIENISARLLTYAEAYNLNCINGEDTCPTWISNSSYWIGSAYDSTYIWYINQNGILDYGCSLGCPWGVRPIIVVFNEDI